MIKCKSLTVCDRDFCDGCANWYEETDEYTATFEPISMPNGSYKFGKVIIYKTPHYDKITGKQILYTIEMPNEEA